MSRIIRLLFIMTMALLPLAAGFIPVAGIADPGAGGPPSAMAATDRATERPAWQAKVDAQVLAQAAEAPTEFIVMLDEQADLSAAAQIEGKAAKGQYVYAQLTAAAARTQGPLLERLRALSLANPTVEYRPFWVANMVWVRGDAAVLQSLASRPEIERVVANPRVQMELPLPAPDRPNTPHAETAPDTIEWGLTKVGAPQAWAQGYTGQGVVIGGQDTGYDWTHPALRDHYRGWNGVSADHNYNWHDAIHSGLTSCGVNSPFPCDDGYHGTHTMGTMVGDDGGSNQVGMAPGARWIGCRNMMEGIGTPATYAECYQWFIAPTDLNNQNPRPDLAPDVINNSWNCPASEGCTDPLVLLDIVYAVRAAGIVTVHAAGNSGPSCETVRDPAAIYAESFTVGASDSLDNLASFSSRGPVTADDSNRLKPDVTAPGVNVRSTFPGGGYSSLQGTSMAAPHVAGMVALILDARPELAGEVDSIERLIRATAVARTHTQLCGGIPGSAVPNNAFGYGRINALAAVDAAEHWIDLVKTPSTWFYSPGDQVTYTLQITHRHPSMSTTNVVLADTLPAGTSFVSATGPYTLNGNQVVWNWASLGPGESRSVTLTVQVQPGNTAIVVNWDYSVRSDGFPSLPRRAVTIYRGDNLNFFPLMMR